MPVVFRIHEDIDYLDPQLKDNGHVSPKARPLAAILPPAMSDALRVFADSGKLEANGWSKPKLASDRWIYVFKSTGGMSIEGEFQVKESGGKQEFKLVSWTPETRSKWVKTYPRPASVTRKAYHLNSGFAYFVLLSGVQLPHSRIKHYLSAAGSAALKRRALEIPKGALANAAALPVAIDLVDAAAVATHAMERAIKARNKFMEEASDKVKAAKRYIADFLWEMSKKEEDFNDWVDMGSVGRFRNDADAKLKPLAGEAKAREAFFYAWMRQGLFEETREDIWDHDLPALEAEEAKWLENEQDWVGSALGCEYGLAYLEEAAGDKTWFHRIFLGTEGTVVKKSIISLSEEGIATLINRFLVGRVLWRLKGLGLGERVLELEKIGSVQVTLIKEVTVITERLKLVVTKFGRKQGAFLWRSLDVQKRVTRIDYQIDAFDVTLKKISTERWKQSVDGLNKVGKSIVLAIEIGNLLGSLGNLADAKSGKEEVWGTLNLVNSACDVMGAIDSIVDDAAGKSFKLVAKKLSLLGSILDYVLYTKGIHDSMSKGRYGLASAYTVAALSAIALATGTALQLGVGGGATAFGLAGGPWTMIGAALIILGAVLIHVFTESDLEEWAKDCCFGKRGKGKEGLSQLGKQIFDLHEVLSKFEVDCFVTSVDIPGTESWDSNGNIHKEYESFLVLRIEAGLFVEGASKFKVKLDATDIKALGSGDNVEIDAASQELKLPDDKTRIGRNKEGRTIVSKWFKLNDRNAKFRAENGKYEYEYSVRLDFKGDGSVLYP